MSYLNAFFMSTATTYEVQRTNNYAFVISAQAIASGFKDDILELACDSVDLPEMSNDPINLDYGNSDVKVAGKAQLQDATLNVKDFIEPNVEKLLVKWREAVYNPKTGKIGWATNYKKDARAIMYGPNGEMARTWVLKGCWPTNLGLGSLDYSSADKRQLTMNISVDNAYPDYSQSRGSVGNKVGTGNGSARDGNSGPIQGEVGAPSYSVY